MSIVVGVLSISFIGLIKNFIDERKPPMSPVLYNGNSFKIWYKNDYVEIDKKRVKRVSYFNLLFVSTGKFVLVFSQPDKTGNLSIWFRDNGKLRHTSFKVENVKEIATTMKLYVKD